MSRERIAKHGEDLRAIRRDLHEHPELLFDVERTAGVVARELARLGYKVATGIAGTGVIGTLTNGAGAKTMGIRADMDALPIHEQTNLPYASKTPGKMHACGHDGHTAMLLGAARYLAETRAFDGTVHLIFQPAEEDLGGGKRMVEEGLFRKFPCDAVFALHNIPGVPAGQIMVRPGAITGSIEVVKAVIRGVGGHGAMPHKATDPIVAAASAVVALQSIVSRNLDPLDSAAITVGAFNSGSLATVIPETATLDIGIRAFTHEVQDLTGRRVREIVVNQAKSFGCQAEFYSEGASVYPAGKNTPAEAALVREVAIELGQKPEHIDMRGPFMFAEDFAFMQAERPSCYFGLGNGDSRQLHDPGYDFNDENLVHGPLFWGRLVERFLRAA
jgi:hippurate hydrolase